MKIIGLTGLTGAGKSTVAQKLMAYGCYHIDADKVAREVINNNENVKNKLKERFGDDVVNEDGTTNRPLLATRAFADFESTNDLNAITHPAVTEEIKSIIKDMEESRLGTVAYPSIPPFSESHRWYILCCYRTTTQCPAAHHPSFQGSVCRPALDYLRHQTSIRILLQFNDCRRSYIRQHRAIALHYRNAQ